MLIPYAHTLCLYIMLIPFSYLSANCNLWKQLNSWFFKLDNKCKNRHATLWPYNFFRVISTIKIIRSTSETPCLKRHMIFLIFYTNSIEFNNKFNNNSLKSVNTSMNLRAPFAEWSIVCRSWKCCSMLVVTSFELFLKEHNNHKFQWRYAPCNYAPFSEKRVSHVF